MGEVKGDTDLKDVALYANSRGVNMYELLQSLFTITNLTDDQEKVLRKQWRRIYTTNYDDAVEFFGKSDSSHPRRSSYTIADTRPSKLPANSIIHLHGYIHSCTKREVLSQLVLDHKSYAEQAALNSPWWDQFERDIQGAQWIFFVGYNLNDFAVAKYLTKNPQLSGRTRFILRPPVNDFMADRLEGYGSVDLIELKGFAKACSSAKTGVPIQNFHQLKAFKLIDPYKDNKSVTRPTPVEIEAFLTRGKMNFQALSSTYPKNEFAIPRSAEIRDALTGLEDSNTLILHSRTANGKSVFADMLSLELTTQGQRCVRYNSRSNISPLEIDFLTGAEKIVVFLGSYDDAIEISDEIRSLGQNVKFIVEINTGTDQVRRTEVQSHLRGPIHRVDLNQIKNVDREDFVNLLTRAGIPADGIQKISTPKTELRDLLIELLKSPYVRDRLKAAVRPLLSDPDAMKVISTACVLRAFSIHAGTNFIRAVTGGDPFDVLLKNEVATFEFGALTPEALELHSATFSEFFLREFVGSESILDIICVLAFEAARRKNGGDHPHSQRSREARKALGSLVQFSKISKILEGTNDIKGQITKLYERLRSNTIINDEPLFWLQYSIFMQDCSQYGIARKHLETAYLRAEIIETFRTYQLDTNYLKLILQAPKGEEGFPGDTETLFELIEKVNVMITGQDSRGHAIRVLEDLKVFCLNFGHILTPGERQRLSLQCFKIVQDLDGLDIQVKTEFLTEHSKFAVQEAAAILARLN
jgi:hypothetical protein